MIERRGRLNFITAVAAIALLAGACALPPSAEAPVLSASRARSSGDAIQDKNFPLLTLLQQDPSVHNALRADTVLVEIGARTSQRLNEAYKTCGASTRCMIEAGMLPADDVRRIAERLAALAATDAAIKTLV